MEAGDLDGARGLSLGPGVLSLHQDPFGHKPITICTENVGITAHLASPFAGDGGDGRHRCEVITFEGLQLQILSAANDVASVDVASGAVLLEQRGAWAGLDNCSVRCSSGRKVQQQNRKRCNDAAQHGAQHRDVVSWISLLEQAMPPFGTAESVHRVSGNPAEASCAIG